MKRLSTLIQLSTLYESHINHKNVQKATLPKEISVVNYQECYKEKGAKFEDALNSTIMKNLVKCRMYTTKDVH